MHLHVLIKHELILQNSSWQLLVLSGICLWVLAVVWGGHMNLPVPWEQTPRCTSVSSASSVALILQWLLLGPVQMGNVLLSEKEKGSQVGFVGLRSSGPSWPGAPRISSRSATLTVAEDCSKFFWSLAGYKGNSWGRSKKELFLFKKL